jgi:membrane-associated HD superfamily phosphohydrolase
VNPAIFKTHKARIIYIIIGIIVFGLLYALKNTGYSLRLATFLFSILLFYAADLWLDLDFKKRHYAIFIIVAVGGIIFSPFYFIFPNYDKALHLIEPIFLSALIFFLLDKVKIKFSAKIILTFAVMIAALSIFEMGEYVLDQAFDFKLQGVYFRDISGVAKLNIVLDKNDDTMIDMLFGTSGALIFVLIRTVVFYERRWNKRIKDYF